VSFYTHLLCQPSEPSRKLSNGDLPVASPDRSTTPVFTFSTTRPSYIFPRVRIPPFSLFRLLSRLGGRHKEWHVDREFQRGGTPPKPQVPWLALFFARFSLLRSRPHLTSEGLFTPTLLQRCPILGNLLLLCATTRSPSYRPILPLFLRKQHHQLSPCPPKGSGRDLSALNADSGSCKPN